MAAYNKPDLSAPRFRSKTTFVLNKPLYLAFLEKYPKYKELSLDSFKEIVCTYNGALWKGAIDNRDGVELPESLGYLIVAKCDRPKGDNIDFVKSIELGQKVNFRNWDSDNYLAKICYTNYSLKYRFANRELWKFSPSKQFRSTASQRFAKMYTKYIHLTKNTRISALYKTM